MELGSRRSRSQPGKAVKRNSKIALVIVSALVIAGGVVGGIRWSRRGLVTVQTGLVTRGDLSAIVTASGEIKPRNYINLGANAQGPITELLVKEGDHVRKGQVVARIERIQPQAELEAQKAAVASAVADAAAAEAGLNAQDQAIATARATVDRSKSDLELARANFQRYEQLYKDQLVARQEYEQYKANFNAAEAGVRENAARLSQIQAQRAQTAAQLSSAQRRVTQAQAMQTRVTDVLAKFDVVAPIDGVVTNLPVRMGETVVPGIQNSPASTVLTIADMSLITAEVKADETDIISVQVGQEATITIDAMPNRTFHGTVIEIGNTAILRSSGLAASQSATSSQEAKDFKVVVALDDPPEEIRPGLSCTAKIVTATRKDVLSIPIQALTVRTQQELEADQNAPATRFSGDEIQGVFVVSDGHAVFRKVETGISGASEIEVTSGLHQNEEIIIGSYKVIRTIRNQARVVVDNRTGPADVGS
jgi:HlyD family secretion protein